MGIFGMTTKGKCAIADNGPVVRAAAEAELRIFERDDDRFQFQFNDVDASRSRKVQVSQINGGELVLFVSMCRGCFDDDDVSGELLATLLVRNDDSPYGHWYASHDEDDDEITFGLSYVTPGVGLTGDFLKCVCMSMVKEISVVESLMEKEGLL